ncbi:MAG: hypothetical protein RMM17_08930 [Acidobacteriota bacterium]|nr:hypothetical protein [Blastocatellia bacterium]MDW8412790.1 hypothetical protein [Acidobacteriota bacterium]
MLKLAPKLKINHQTAAQRCEICHQSDCLKDGHCTRCGQLSSSSSSDNFLVRDVHINDRPIERRWPIATTIPVGPVWKGGLVGLIIARLFTEYMAIIDPEPIELMLLLIVKTVCTVVLLTVFVPLGCLVGVVIGFIKSNLLVYRARRVGQL